MDHQLTVGAIARRAETLAHERSVIARTVDGGSRRGSWLDTITRARRLAAALTDLGVHPGDRVATLCWNQQEHLDLYFGVPMMGAVLHTLNARLAAADLAYIVRSADSQVLIVDETLCDLMEAVRRRAPIDQVVVVSKRAEGRALCYDDLLAGFEPASFVEADVDERDACTLCFTTGTTGRPKGVLYSHRAVALQALSTMAADFGGVRESDTVLVLVPMFHGNAWNHPYAAALAGASLVLPHSDLRADVVLETIERERVTMTGGVPTIWQDILTELDRQPGRFDLTSLRAVRIGGSKLPMSLLRGLEERHGVPVLAGFGMTELGPIGGMAGVPSTAELSEGERWLARAKTGRPLPFLEVRARDEHGLVAWNGDRIGELEFRGPSVSSGYWGDLGSDAFTEDGWLRSGDLATIDQSGLIDIRDRKKDMIKSGGEWISSLVLEQTLGMHPAVEDAAVIAIPHPRWQERPLALVVARPAQKVSEQELLTHLSAHVPRWWLPDRFEFVSEVPRTGVGKIRKRELRARFAPTEEAGVNPPTADG